MGIHFQGRLWTNPTLAALFWNLLETEGLPLFMKDLKALMLEGTKRETCIIINWYKSLSLHLAHYIIIHVFLSAS